MVNNYYLFWDFADVLLYQHMLPMVMLVSRPLVQSSQPLELVSFLP